MDNDLQELIGDLEFVSDDRRLTQTLITIATLFDARSCSDAEGEGRRADDVLKQLAEAVEQLGSRFKEHFRNGDVLGASGTKFLKSEFIPPEQWTFDPHFSWKPINGLWTSPRVLIEGDPSIVSAWLLRARDHADTNDINNVSFWERSSIDSRLIGSLEEALDFAPDSETFHEACMHDASNGIHVVDFSWRVVIESELAGLRREIDPMAYPCGLGVESSLWLRPPQI